jgi:hypothetical protein
MRFVASILNFALSFLPGCGLIPSTKQAQTSQLFRLSSEESQTSDAFPRELEGRRVKRTNLDISISPKITKIRPRNLYLANGETPVLSIPIEITNSSSTSVKVNLTHEWYGGIWPPTDLYVAVQMRGAASTFWADAPGYQVGEKDSIEKGTVLKSGETKIFDIRLNWPGTGSISTKPLIDESKAGKYSIRFLLFFQAGASEEYLETQAFEVEVE